MSTGIGDTLRDAREHQGRTLEELARSLRLRSEQLRALEEERFGSFGGDIYARGFLKSYARELGLDPQPLLDTYRHEVATEDLSGTIVASGAAVPPRVAPARGAPPGWIVWVLAAVVVLVGLGFLGQFAGGRVPETASPDPPTAPPSPASPEDEAEAEDADTDGDGEGDDAGGEDPGDDGDEEPEETFDGVDLLLALEEDSWMRVSVDGTVVYEQVATSGETLPFEGEEEVIVRFGNAGGVRVELNGEDLGTPGARGAVVEVSYSPDGPDA